MIAKLKKHVGSGNNPYFCALPVPWGGRRNDSDMRTIELTYPLPGGTIRRTIISGTEVADPYRWLEDDRSDETVRWVAAENEVTRRYLSQFPERDRIAARLAELWDYPKYGIPERHGDSRFSLKTTGCGTKAFCTGSGTGRAPRYSSIRIRCRKKVRSR